MTEVDPSLDAYQVLGVDPKASADEIKRVFRKLAKQYHPDSTGGDKRKEARFKEISAAYEIVGDPARRAKYDELREQMRTGRFRVPSPGGAGGPGPQVWDLSDLFAQFFAGAGAGAAAGSRGGVRVEHVEFDGGDGWPFGGEPPAGRSRRSRRREARRGPAPEPAAPSFTSRIRAADGSWLTVKGGDVHSDLRIPFQDAILGTVREIATVAGATRVKIPPGTASGVKLRLRGKGVLGPTGEAGDHYVNVQIDVPRDLDDEARRRLVELVAHLDKLRRPR